MPTIDEWATVKEIEQDNEDMARTLERVKALLIQAAVLIPPHIDGGGALYEALAEIEALEARRDGS